MHAKFSGLTACTPGSSLGTTLGNEYGKSLLFYFQTACTFFQGGPISFWCTNEVASKNHALWNVPYVAVIHKKSALFHHGLLKLCQFHRKFTEGV